MGELPYPSMDHGRLSPSGRVSRRAAKEFAARDDARVAAEWAARDRAWAESPEGMAHRRAQEVKDLRERADAARSSAKFMRHLADQGIRVRVHGREAERYEARALELDAQAAALEAGHG